jgi:hypothetical protein
MERLIDRDPPPHGRASFGATVFRQDGSAASVVVSEFMFDGCLLSSDVTFVQDERLRLYQSGQGCILMTVTESEGGQVRALFVTG